MRVCFDAGAFKDEASWRFLRKILELIDDGWHEWHVVDPDIIEETQWFSGLDMSFRRMFRKAAQVSLRQHETSPSEQRRIHTKLLLVGEEAPPQSLAADRAYKFLKRPLKILMEDDSTDGDFLNAVLAVLANPETLRLLKDAAIVYYGPGGNGNLKNRVISVDDEAKREGMPLRAVVFTDSDGHRPGEVHQNAQLVKDECDRRGVPCVLLKKRSIENYVPDEVIREWRDEVEQTNQTNMRGRIEALLNLDRELRDHFPVKKGLSSQKLPPDELQWYQSRISADDFRQLRERGFGDDFIRILFVRRDDGTKQPRRCLTAEALRQRDGCGQLDELVQYIEMQV